MLFPKIDPKEWADTYCIKLPEAVCAVCGVNLVFDIPFAHLSFRGLISSHGGCGEEFVQSVFITTNEGERQALGLLPSQLYKEI